MNQDGRLDYLDLLAQYGGKGNKAMWVKEARDFWTLLIYNNQKAMLLEKFLTNTQTMFTGFSKNEEILNDLQKIRLLFQKVQNPILTQIKASLQVSYDLDQTNTVTYDFIWNIQAAEAASIGDHNPRGVTDVNTCGNKSLKIGVTGVGGAILTRF